MANRETTLEDSGADVELLPDGRVRLFDWGEMVGIDLTPADIHQLSEWVGEQLGESK